jgi:hypothetical protein
MNLGPSARLRLAPEDEYTHPIEAAQNFNESMYINVFDHAQRMGGWFRVGNRPNEGHAEMSCCLHFADGGAGFMFQRPSIDGNETIAAGGMAFEIVKPLEQLRVSYDGTICMMNDPQDMASPKRAFTSNPIVACRVAIDFHGISPVFGGEKVDEHGKPLQEAPEEAFARAHYEQHVRGTGTITVGDRTWSIDGLGLRDHSWGPRYWQNLSWYRWLPMAFSEDFALVLSIVTLRHGRSHVWGVVLRKDASGKKDYVLVEDASISSEYDQRHQAVGQTLRLRTKEREYVVTGKSLSLVPLRNRRKTDDGSELSTRITEAMTEFRCDGLIGYGMSEYLDQIIDGVPVGRHC